MGSLEDFLAWIRRNFDRLSNAAKVAVLLLFIFAAAFGLRGCFPTEDIPSMLPDSFLEGVPGSVLTSEERDGISSCSIDINETLCRQTAIRTFDQNGQQCEFTGEYGAAGRVNYDTVTVETASGNTIRVKPYCLNGRVQIPSCSGGRLVFQPSGPDVSNARIRCYGKLTRECREGVVVEVFEGQVIDKFFQGDNGACIVPEDKK